MKVLQAKHFQTVLVRQQRKSRRNSKYFIKITCIDERVIESKGKAKEIQNIEITYLDESLLRVVPVI